VPRALQRPATGGLAAITAIALAGCGLNVTSPDLFLLRRSGQEQQLTVLVNDDGTVRCNGHKAPSLSDSQLLQARDLASTLNKDAKARLHIPVARNSVYSYEIRLEHGAISFGDTAAANHRELAQAELLTVDLARGQCAET
jgi:hypothetical protein